MPVEFEVKGLKELNDTILKMMKSVEPDKVEPVLKKGAALIASAVRRNTPVGPAGKNRKPGNLKKAVRVKLLKRERYDQPAPAIAAIDRKKAPHAHLVEYGHGGPQPAPPHPFFRPAVDATQGPALIQIEQKLGAMIEEGMR